MVKFLINLCQNRNILRVKAHKWYPIKNAYDEMSEEGVNEVVEEDEEEEWKIPKKSCKRPMGILKITCQIFVMLIVMIYYQMKILIVKQVQTNNVENNPE